MQPTRPTIADVAQRAGVSKGLVSFALNGRPGVSGSTRDRILAAASELGWQPSIRARSLSVGKAFALGLVIARDPAIIAADPFFPAFISGVEQELSRSGSVLMLAMVPTAEQEAETYRTLAKDRRVDGVFVSDLRFDDERIGLLAELGIPAVTLGHAETPGPHPAVTVDDGPGIRAAVEHLVGLGHRRIAHVAGTPTLLHGGRRRAEFEAAMHAARLEPAGIVPTDFTATAGARATVLLLDSPEPPTAIVYANDPMAIAGMSVAQSRGLSVPRELSVIGFDGSDIGRHLDPRLTSVATDIQSWGRAACRALLDHIDGVEVSDLELAPARLLDGDSTAPPPDVAPVPGAATT